MHELVTKNKHLFWSYDLEKSLPDRATIIEQLLKYGDLEDLVSMFALFPYDYVLSVWQNTMQGVGQFKKQNTFLCLFFFKYQSLININAINKRHERIAKLASQNGRGVS